MNIGVAACGSAILLLVVVSALFAILKGRAAMLISGYFPSLTCGRFTTMSTFAFMSIY